jgi:hypothetical protein
VFASRPGAQRPLQAQQQQAQAKTDRAVAKLPRAPLPAPPVIRNPTPAQVHAATGQLARGVTAAVGSYGTAAQRLARRDALLREIKSQPRYARVQRSIAHWTAEQAKLVVPGRPVDRVAPGRAPSRVRLGVGPLNLGTVNLTAASRAVVGAAEKAAPGLRSATAEAHFGRNAVSDIAHLPLMVPQTAYEVGRAALDASHGDTKRAKELAKGFTQGVYGHVARGDWNGLAEYVREHPVYAALELRGGKGVVGRGAGATMRSGVLGQGARRAASTAREDIPLAPGARVADRQHYSPDVITKALQVATEKIRGRGKTVTGDHRLRRRADMESDTAAAMSRAVRQDEAVKTRATRPKGPLSEVVGLVVQGVVRPGRVEADLRKELARLDREHGVPGNFSTVAQRKQNRTTADAIRTVLGSPKTLAKLGDAVESGRANVKAINALEAKAVAQDALSPARAERAKLFPAAQAHLQAERRGMTRTQGRRVVAKARTELERARGARDHVMARLRSEGVRKPTTHPDYVKAARRVAKAKQGLSDARELRRSGAVMLRDHKNDPLPNAAIRAQLPEDVAYLPHHTQNRGARAYYQTAFAGRKNLDTSKARTGRAFKIGAADASHQAIEEHRVRLRGVVNRIAEHDRIIHSIAIKGPGGRMMTWDQAEKIAANAKEHGAKLVPYRAVPGSYDKERMARIADSQNAAEMPALGEMIGHEFEERLREPAPADRSARNVVLVPEQIVNQLREQQKVSGSAGRVGNVLADVFRRAVLPFSVRWLAGNTIEAIVRLASVAAGPNAHRIGKGIMGELGKIDEEQAIRVKAALTGGLLYGNKGLTVRRFAEHFEGTAAETPAKLAATAGRLPVVHQLGQAIKHFSDAVFSFNRRIESAAQYAALGKYAKREIHEMTGSWRQATRAQEKALHDVANGLMDSKNIHDAARYIDQTLGQYSRFSPAMRRMIQSATPFLPWYLNSVRWVFWTLPAKHPIKSGIMALAAQNLQADFDAQHSQVPPGDLRADLIAGGHPIPSARYTPFGAFGGVLGGGNEQLQAVVDPFFPQFKTAALAAFGLNFTGHGAKIDPRSRKGEGVPGAVRASMAFNSLLEAFVPGVAQARRLREGGSTPFDNSTLLSPKTKPGTRTRGGAARRILDPFRPSPITVHTGEQAPAVVAAPTPVAQPAASNDPWAAVDAAMNAAGAQPTGPDPWDTVK